MKKKEIWKVVYWNVAALIIWLIFFLSFKYAGHRSWVDALVVPSVILMGVYLIALLFKFGLMETTIVSMKRSFFNSKRKTKQRKEDPKKKNDKPETIEQYRINNKERSYIPYTPIIIYIIFIVVGVAV